MPLYDFECGSCAHNFEAYTPRADDRRQPRDCPKCHGLAEYAGISQVVVGKEGYFGLITTDGQRHRGSLPSR